MPFLVPFIPAIIGATATVGAAALGASAADKANKNALAAQSQATDKSLAAQQAALDRITSLNQPFIDAGRSTLSPLQQRVQHGAPNFSAPSYALPQGAHTPQPGPSTAKATGTAVDPAGAGPAGFGPTTVGDAAYRSTVADNGQTNGQNTDATVSMLGGGTPPPGVGATPVAGTPQAATPSQSSGPDWDAYIAANPDVAAWIQQGHGDPNLGPNQTPEQAAAYQYQNTGQAEGRQLPTTQATPAQDPNAPPPQPLDLGTASPVVADYTRPDQPTTPTFGESPNAASFLNGANFTASPGYQWRLQQGQRNLNANFGARGLLKSGGAIQGAIDYGQNQASNEYNNWFNQQQQLYADTANQFNADRSSGLNQFNVDRNNTNNNFSEDRSYGTNLALNNRDFANNQYNTQTQNLFQLAGVGANAAAAIGGANNNYANNASNLYTNQGNNAAGAALANGQTQAQLYGTIGSTAANLFSSPSRYTGGTPLALQSYSNPAAVSPAYTAGANSMFSSPMQAPITY